VVADLHPDYLSTRYAEESGLDMIQVQHHHAHIASCMAEYNLDEKVIGVSFDGIGYGADKKIWGGEFFICDLEDFERPFHFEYMPMPGGDKATEEPWRMAVSYLYKCFGKEFLDLKIPFITTLKEDETNLVLQAIDKKINAPLTSSAGRLFDAVAAIAGLCTHADFHAEAPMRLESAIDKSCGDPYPFTLAEKISFTETIHTIVDDLRKNVHPSIVAAKFHNTIISVIFATVTKLAERAGIRNVVISGGTFQNRYILERIETMLEENACKVFSPHQVPANDGGIALGQLAIAAKRRN
jgi:hydrogenase maturation protein HypF